MTPRSTDWTLAALVGVLLATGLLSFVSGRTQDAWVFTAHGIGGAALGLVTGWKLRRVWRRVGRRWDRRTWAGVLSTFAVALTLGSGWAWSGGADLFWLGFNLLNWHVGLGVAVSVLVLVHSVLRRKPLRLHDLQGRRQFLHALGVGAGAVAAWRLQRPAAAQLGWRGAERRWTGSYEYGSFAGNAFPATSWIADAPQPLDAAAYRLHVGGLVQTPLTLTLADLALADERTATLDCTGGFYSAHRWRGCTVAHLIQQAGPLPTAAWVRVTSHTGYRWSFPIAEAADLLLARTVDDDALDHGHGGPVRLVAPGRRGFQWIKWVVRIDLIAGYDYGAPASTVWSSWGAAGRGEG